MAGHQRVKQLRRRGAEFKFDDGKPSIILDGKPFPIRVVDWDRGFETAANVEANNQKVAGHFNDDLDEILGEIQASVTELQFDQGQLLQELEERGLSCRLLIS